MTLLIMALRHRKTLTPASVMNYQVMLGMKYVFGVLYLCLFGKFICDFVLNGGTLY